jgi:hypothetical protein
MAGVRKKKQTGGQAAQPKGVKSAEAIPPRSFSNHAIHLMRTTQNNTLALAQMADQKASILLGATFLVFSLSVSRALTGQLSIALTILAAFSFLSSLCAVMAVLPTVKRPEGSKEDQNPLFFGHFAYREEAEWTDEVLDKLANDEIVFRTIARDIYQNGKVLQGKKYTFLSFAYKIFISGLVITLAVFAAEMIASQ